MIRIVPIILVTVILVIGCNKVEPELNLLNPQNEYTGRLDSIKFEWISNEVGTKNLVISDDHDFSKIVLDTMIDKDFFISVDYSPNTDYFWKIRTKKLESEAQFKTTDPLNEILPEYDVETKRTRWSRTPEGSETTTFHEKINFAKEDDRIRVQFGQGRVDRLCKYYDYFEDRYQYGYLPGHSNGTYFYIDTENREIEISSRSGGLGSGTVYYTKFNY